MIHADSVKERWKRAIIFRVNARRSYGIIYQILGEDFITSYTAKCVESKKVAGCITIPKPKCYNGISNSFCKGNSCSPSYLLSAICENQSLCEAALSYVHMFREANNNKYQPKIINL